MNNTVKVALTLGLLTVIGTGGAAMVANARSLSPVANSVIRIAQTVDNEANEGPESKDDTEDAQEIARYQSLVKITPQQARQKAEAAQEATATKLSLEVEDGSLVYKVDFANAEVLVDAGNGQILKTELAGQEENDATEVTIQGSIQVPDNDQEQGETQQ
ncbi:PepSY domain-containing protein [Synechocystis sp. LEGE 06083]|jgi:uncharacterized membrane protein YkoI|uniref:PepSY domain-containing protein n=1 Tax=Synechocystis sp. LEGE 06083 TaxID=915336 RepID=UPI00187FF83E|nr:PepSY domain-containing protein [Synechocystis sp. LEGE 06083]MBE9193965.1 PepSY domain-containing protein [Synechocystis sp. LEGE 06083]